MSHSISVKNSLTGKDIEIDLVQAGTLTIISFCTLVWVLLLNKLPYFTANFIVGALTPLYGTFQLVFGWPIDSLMASESHWQLYWLVYGTWYLVDSTILLPISYFLLPRTYNFLKSFALVYLFLPETNGLHRIMALLEATPAGKSLLQELTKVIDLPRDYDTLRKKKKTKRTKSQRNSLDTLLNEIKFSKETLSLDYRLRQMDEGHIAWKKRVRKQNFILAEIVHTEESLNESLTAINEKLGTFIINESGNFEWTDESIGAVLKKYFETWFRLTRNHTKIEGMMKILLNFSGEGKKMTVNVDAVLKLISILEIAYDRLLPRMYNDYCGMYELALQVFSLELNQNASFRDFVHEKKENLPKRGLEIHLIRPVQRLVQYPLLLKELRKTLAPGETYDRLNSLIKNLTVLAQKANKEASRAQNMMMMAEVNDRLRFPTGIMRTFSNGSKSKKKERLISLMEGEERELFVGKSAGGQKPLPGMVGVFVKMAGYPVKRHNVLLYNDLILVTQVKKSWLPPHDKVYYVKLMLPLAKGTIIEPRVQTDFFKTGEQLHTVGIQNAGWGDVDSITLGFVQEDDRDYWADNMIRALRFANSHVNSTDKLFKTGNFPAKVVFGQRQENIDEVVETETDIRKQESAAILIQSRYRGLSARKMYKERRETMLNSVLLIQRFAIRARKKREQRRLVEQ